MFFAPLVAALPGVPVHEGVVHVEDKPGITITITIIMIIIIIICIPIIIIIMITGVATCRRPTAQAIAHVHAWLRDLLPRQ